MLEKFSNYIEQEGENCDEILNEIQNLISRNEAFLECLKTLHELKFIVRVFVCDDHASNASAYTKLLSDYNDNSLLQLIST